MALCVMWCWASIPFRTTFKFPSDFGATIGRYANRINQGKITVDGVEYQLPRNNYGHCLHGGPKGYQYQVFDARQLSSQVLELTYLYEDEEEGFPGNLTLQGHFLADR